MFELYTNLNTINKEQPIHKLKNYLNENLTNTGDFLLIINNTPPDNPAEYFGEYKPPPVLEISEGKNVNIPPAISENDNSRILSEINEKLNKIPDPYTFERIDRRTDDIARKLDETNGEILKNYTQQITREISEKIENFDPLRKNKKGSSEIGKIGEDYMRILLEATGLRLSVEEIGGKESHLADVHAIDRERNIFYVFELKNYARTVKREEVEKFKKDMQTIKETRRADGMPVIGVFISWKTKIANIGEFYIDENNFIYIGEAEKYINPDTLRIILIFFGDYIKKTKENTATNNEQLKQVLDKINQHKQKLRSNAEKIKAVLDNVKQNERELNNILKELTEEQKTLERFSVNFSTSQPLPAIIRPGTPRALSITTPTEKKKPTKRTKKQAAEILPETLG